MAMERSVEETNQQKCAKNHKGISAVESIILIPRANNKGNIACHLNVIVRHSFACLPDQTEAVRCTCFRGRYR